MHNDQRSQPTGPDTVPESEPALSTAVPRDADVVQSALRLHLRHFHTLEAAHAEVEQVLTEAVPTSPAAAQRAAAHHARQEAFGHRRGFLEQLVNFPVSALSTLSGADAHSLRLPNGAGVGALRAPLSLYSEQLGSSQGEVGFPEREADPHTWTTAETETVSPSVQQGPLYPEDSPDYVEEHSEVGFLDEITDVDEGLMDLFGETTGTETWELVPAGGGHEGASLSGQGHEESPESAEVPGDEHPAPEQRDAAAAGLADTSEPAESLAAQDRAERAPRDQGEESEAAVTSYLPEGRPDFRDLVHGRAEIPETSPKKQRRWVGLRRKRQRER